jgi:hypothetical protein
MKSRSVGREHARCNCGQKASSELRLYRTTDDAASPAGCGPLLLDRQECSARGAPLRTFCVVKRVFRPTPRGDAWQRPAMLVVNKLLSLSVVTTRHVGLAGCGRDLASAIHPVVSLLFWRPRCTRRVLLSDARRRRHTHERSHSWRSIEQLPKDCGSSPLLPSRQPVAVGVCKRLLNVRRPAVRNRWVRERRAW